jgi:hypothetical protein
MTTNTKRRHKEILAAAVKALEDAGGVEIIDALPQEERTPQLRKMADSVIGLANCTRTPARSNVAKALHQARYALMQAEPDMWGGTRPNAGPPRLPEDQKRQPVSTKLAPGSKELAQAIAEVLELPGWGHSVDQALVLMVEGNPELRRKLADMGVILKSKSCLPNKSKEY